MYIDNYIAIIRFLFKMIFSACIMYYFILNLKKKWKEGNPDSSMNQ